VSDVPDLGPKPQRITVEPEQVRRLVDEQFPQWATLPVAPVRNGGWDNWTFHLGAASAASLTTRRIVSMRERERFS
jgi:aminoglycoside phosphotransferase (APT) family kinase protein